MNYELGAIGAGNMATAIIKGIIKAGVLAPEKIAAFDISAEKRAQMNAIGVDTPSDIPTLVKECRYLLFAVKPQNIDDALAEVAKAFVPGQVAVTIAAGISTAHLASFLGKDAKIVRAMPNTPLMLGEGATALCHTPAVTAEEFAFVRRFFEAAGCVQAIDESLMNTVIAVNGSTPAYIYLYAKYFCDYAAEHGIDRDAANILFAQTLIGSAKMMTDSGLTHQQLIDMVSSPGGTTLKGLEALEKGNLKQLVDDCCDATVKRAAELGK